MNDDGKSKGVLTFFVEERVQVSQSAVLLPCLRVLMMMMMNYYKDVVLSYTIIMIMVMVVMVNRPLYRLRIHLKLISKKASKVGKLISFMGMTICRAYVSICWKVSLSVFLH